MIRYLLAGIAIITIAGSIILYFHNRDQAQFQKGFDAGASLEKLECEQKQNQVQQTTNNQLNANIKTKNKQSRFVVNDSDVDTARWLQLFEETRAEFNSK